MTPLWQSRYYFQNQLWTTWYRSLQFTHLPNRFQCQSTSSSSCFHCYYVAWTFDTNTLLAGRVTNKQETHARLVIRATGSNHDLSWSLNLSRQTTPITLDLQKAFVLVCICQMSLSMRCWDVDRCCVGRRHDLSWMLQQRDPAVPWTQTAMTTDP